MAKDPKKGTGKKPKGSGRRLYTDENPKDTVSIKFATPADARATVAKVKRVNKPYARKIQILTVGEQRAKVMGKTQVVNIFKKGKFQACGRKSAKSSKRKYPKCVPRSKAKTMTASQIKSAVSRKRSKTQGVGGKPTNVKTIVKKKTNGKRSKKRNR